jgi:hypothetical protein
MTFQLIIRIGNEAMSEPQHVAAALEDAARRIERGELVPGWAPIIDGNGNTVGRFEVVDG